MRRTSNQEFAKARHSTEQGYTLVELLIVVIIVMLLAALAIPNLLKSRILANESSAVSSIREINTAQGTYSSSWGAGYAPALTNLGGPAPCLVATLAGACILDPALTTGASIKAGYAFIAVGTLPDASGLLNGFEVNGTPVSVRISGMRAFCSDASGVVKFVTPGVAPIGVAAGSCGAVANIPGTSGPIGE